MRIWLRDGGTCWLCFEHVPFLKMTLDHFIPRSKGGTHAIINLRTAHRRCNEIRGDKDVDPGYLAVGAPPVVARTTEDRIAAQKRAEIGGRYSATSVEISFDGKPLPAFEPPVVTPIGNMHDLLAQVCCHSDES